MRNAQSRCVKPFQRLASVCQPVSVTGVAALHRLLPCASLRPPPVLYIPQGRDVPAGSDWSELRQSPSIGTNSLTPLVEDGYWQPALPRGVDHGRRCSV
jgi:hypothetical protein